MVFDVPNISALIRILNLTCLLANGQHQVFEKWPEWFRTWKLTVGYWFDVPVARIRVITSLMFPSKEYEFWKRSQLDEIVNMLKMMVEDLPISTRPPFPGLCCTGGRYHACSVCGKVFRRAHLMIEHRNDVHLGRKWKCECGVKVMRKNVARHLKSKRHNSG